IAGEAADDAAERAPFAQIPRRETYAHDERGAPMLIKMKAVARRAAGEPGAERRRAALEIRARAAHAVGIDDDAGIAVGDVLAAHRRHDGLIVDAGVGHQHAERLERGDRAALAREHPVLLPEPRRG